MNGENKYIDELIQKLQSPDAATRAEACERLRDYPMIPIEAVQALQEAANDPDETVASAARRALAVHLPPEAAPAPAFQDPTPAPLIESTPLSYTPAKHFSWSQVWIKATTNPSVASYQELLDDPAASPSRGLIWIGVVSVVYSLIFMLFLGVSMIPLLSDYGGIEIGSTLIFVACGAPVIAISMVLGVMLSAAIMNLIARAMGGEGNYAKLVYIVSAFSAPLLLISGLISAIPIVGMVGSLISFYMLGLYVLAIMTVYKFSTGKAILAYFIPTIVVCVVMACIIALMIPVFSTLIESGF